MEPIKLAVGEAALVEAPVAIVMSLTSGSAEIAGRPLAANESCLFPSARRGVVVYSLDGGVVSIALANKQTTTASAGAAAAAAGGMPFARVTRFPAQVPALLPLARMISKLPFGSRVVVFGRRGQGKTLAAQTLVNMLFRDSVTERRDAFEHVTLITGDASASGLADSVAPGCVSAIRVTRPGLASGVPFFHEMHINFFRAIDPQQLVDTSSSSSSSSSVAAGGKPGAAAAVEDEENDEARVQRATQATHWLSQALECSSAALASGQTITIIDAESPPQSSSSGSNESNNNNTEMHYTNIIDAVDPALVVYVGEVSSSSSGGGGGGGKKIDPECALLESILRRAAGGGAALANATTNVANIPSLVPANMAAAAAAAASQNSATRQQFINDKIDLYFCGSSELPLKCAKIVVPLNKLNFLGVSRRNAQSFKALRIDAASKRHLLEGRICAVSLAAVEAEAAFANVAGLVLVHSIDPEENEVVLYAPMGGDGAESTNLVRSFLLVGENSLRYSGLAVEENSV